MTEGKKFNVLVDNVTVGQVGALHGYPEFPDYKTAMPMIPARKRQMYGRNIPTYDLRLRLDVTMTDTRGKIRGRVVFAPIAE